MKRHLKAAVLLPGMVTITIPAVILATSGTGVGWDLEAPWSGLTLVAGATLVMCGLALWWWTVRLFARLGEGTLAPWDPTQKLVVAGPYGYVRNPMITAVLAVLIGEAVLAGSPWIAAWALAFFAINALWFTRVEEPGLLERFGDEYERYRREVPRWMPRRTPWSPGSPKSRLSRTP